MIGSMRMEVAASAEEGARPVVGTYLALIRSFRAMARTMEANRADPMRRFSGASREDFWTLEFAYTLPAIVPSRPARMATRTCREACSCRAVLRDRLRTCLSLTSGTARSRAGGRRSSNALLSI